MPSIVNLDRIKKTPSSGWRLLVILLCGHEPAVRRATRTFDAGNRKPAGTVRKDPDVLQADAAQSLHDIGEDDWVRQIDCS